MSQNIWRERSALQETQSQNYQDALQQNFLKLVNFTTTNDSQVNSNFS